MVPAQASYMKEKFGGEFVLQTFTNNNSDNTWMFKSDDVVLLVEEEYSRIYLTLGGTSHRVRDTGKIRSDRVSIDFQRSSRDVGVINEIKKECLEDIFSGHDTIYTAWIDEFGERTIRSDNR